MTHYIDIELKPTKELRENILLNQVYTAFHKRLYDLNSNNIGVSFPQYYLRLGKLFRIHAIKDVLEIFILEDWLGEYTKYCKISKILVVPQNVQHRNISRIQQNMSEAKLRRVIKRGNISQEEIKQYRIKMFQGGLDNPYVELKSMSNGQLHRRFIKFGDFQQNEIKGTFDLFGLSRNSTIPCF